MKTIRLIRGYWTNAAGKYTRFCPLELGGLWVRGIYSNGALVATEFVRSDR